MFFFYIVEKNVFTCEQIHIYKRKIQNCPISFNTDDKIKQLILMLSSLKFNWRKKSLPLNDLISITVCYKLFNEDFLGTFIV